MKFTLWWKLPPSIKAWPLCSSQWLKGHKVWLKPKALWAYKHARWKPCCCGIFCSRFHPILSPLKIILEMVFWTNLMLDLICTWLEKTRRFCRQVNKKISSCFWTASTCVQRSSLGWCSRLTYMETVDWIHVSEGGGKHDGYRHVQILLCMDISSIIKILNNFEGPLGFLRVGIVLIWCTILWWTNVKVPCFKVLC